MKVKIEDTVYDARDVPIMLIFDEKSKHHIANMLPEATKYAAYPENWFNNFREVLQWMDEIYEHSRESK